jgi:hypothetical protein
MLKKCLLIIALIFPTFLFAQFSDDPKEEKLVKDECGDIVFTSVQQFPSLKPSKEVFEDSLTVYLKSINKFEKNKTITFKFIVTKNSELVGIRKISGEYTNEKDLTDALSNLAGFWIPAQQHSHSVCAYATCELEFSSDKITINTSPELYQFHQ